MLLALACASSAVSDDALRSLLPNGSFEALESGAPEGFALEAHPGQGGGASVALDRTQRSQGRISLRLQTTREGIASVTSEAFGVEPGKPYLLSLVYRAEGMAREGRYAGVRARIDVVWSGPAGELGRDGIRAPYQSLDWERLLRFMVAPGGASSATVRATLSADAGSPATRVWLDDLRFRSFATRPAPDAKEWTWYAGDYDVDRPRTDFRPVADEEATKGRSVIAHPGHHRAGRTMFKVGNLEELPPGAYRAVFRLKGEPVASTKTVATVDVFLGNSRITLPVAGVALTANDFAGPRSYRTFAVPFIRPPGDKVTLRVHWAGGMPVWVDSITVREEQLVDEGAFSDVLAR